MSRRAMNVADNRAQSFAIHAVPAVDALKSTTITLEADLASLLAYFGEDPASTKTEDFFASLVTFASALAVRPFPSSVWLSQIRRSHRAPTPSCKRTIDARRACNLALCWISLRCSPNHLLLVQTSARNGIRER